MLHAFAEMDAVPLAHAKLLAIARSRTESDDLRRQAIHWIGERETPAAAATSDSVTAGEWLKSRPAASRMRSRLPGFPS